MSYIEFQDINKYFGQNHVLKGINLSIEKGELLTLLGSSGCGKSTLLRCLAGLEPVQKGKIYLDGTDITTLDETALAIFRRRQIGLIYQFYNLIPILTVEENMTLPLLLDDKKVDRAHFDSLVQVLGLQHRLGHLPSELSGGQQQRVSIGRALMNNPAILLADEPTGNLDSKNSKEIVELLRSFNKSLNQTVIIITHDERIALDADRVIAVEDGKIVKDEVIRQ